MGKDSEGDGDEQAAKGGDDDADPKGGKDVSTEGQEGSETEHAGDKPEAPQDTFVADDNMGGSGSGGSPDPPEVGADDAAALKRPRGGEVVPDTNKSKRPRVDPLVARRRFAFLLSFLLSFLFSLFCQLRY